MEARQIENWALRIVDCVKNGQPNEDFLVELKSDWIDKYKAARRVAGHANAAQGQNILWLIGVDEKNGVQGVNENDLASWYSTIESFFDGLSPSMTPLNISIDNKTIVALLFDTTRAPFLVKNPNYGSQGVSIEYEVPWRENTSIRTARRNDLIRLLVPLTKLPEVEILDGYLSKTLDSENEIKEYPIFHEVTGHPIFDELILSLDLYITPNDQNRLVIPFHKCKVEFRIPNVQPFISTYLELSEATGLTNSIDTLTVQSTSSEMIITGPGKVCLKASANRPNLLVSQKDIKDIDVQISVFLAPANSEHPVILTKTLPYPYKKIDV